MDEYDMGGNTREVIKEKLRQNFDGRIVRKDLTNVPISDEYPEKFDRPLCGGIWGIVQLEYETEGDSTLGIVDIDGSRLRSKQKKQKDISPISIRKLTPIQMPHIDIDELKQGRKAFTKDEWHGLRWKHQSKRGCEEGGGTRLLYDG